VAIGESKDDREILKAFTAASPIFTFTSFATQGRHATKPQRLANVIEEFGTWARAIDDPVEALEIARRQAAADDIVVVTGSTFIVAELREWWFEHVATETVLW
jgi:folylpolyglutamate synthase/dihydropteroate synthase